MQTKAINALLTGAALMMSACGGSSSGTPFTLDSYDAVFDRADEIALSVNDTELAARDVLGTSGSASYQGALFLEVPDRPTIGVIGEMRLTLDLATDQVSGEAGNFFTLIEEPAAGRLTFSGGAFSETVEAQFSADVDGEIAFEDEDRDIDGVLNGFLGGADAEFIVGDIVANNTAQDAATDLVVGEFILER